MAEAAEAAEASSSSLSDIFGVHPSPVVEKAASADEKPSKSEGSVEGDQKFLESEASPPEKEDAEDKKPEKPSEDVKKESEKVPDAKSDSQEKEEKPSQDDAKKWESDENPFYKRYRDTSANWNKEHQARLQMEGQLHQMQQEMVRLQKIADGTYDPEKDDPARQYTPQAVASKALEVGKALASRSAAVQQYGEEKVSATLDEFHNIFGGNEMIQHLVLNHEAPVYEAMRILERYHFEKQYGSTPTDIRKSIRAEVEKELRDSLRKEITEELMGKVDKAKNTPRGLSSSRGSNGLSSGQNSKGKGHTPLGEIFGK